MRQREGRSGRGEPMRGSERLRAGRDVLVQRSWVAGICPTVTPSVAPLDGPLRARGREGKGRQGEGGR